MTPNEQELIDAILTRLESLAHTKSISWAAAEQQLRALFASAAIVAEPNVDASFVGGAQPTHYCKVCNALWRRWDDGSWNLRSKQCGKCCDNVAMGDQIVPMTYDGARATDGSAQKFSEALRPLAAQQQTELNQCDGCQSAAPIQNGKHVDENGYAFMVCQRYRYEQAESQSIYQEQVGNGLWQDVSKELHDAIKDGRVRGAARTVYVTQQAEPGADERAACDAAYERWTASPDFRQYNKPGFDAGYRAAQSGQRAADLNDLAKSLGFDSAEEAIRTAGFVGQRAGVAADDLPTLTGALGTFEFGIQWDGIGEPSFMIVNGHFMGGSGFLTYPRMLQSVAKFVQDYAVTYDARNPIAAAPTQQQEGK